MGDFSSSTTCKRLWAGNPVPAGLDAPTLYVAIRSGVLASLRAPGAPLRRLRRTWLGCPAVGPQNTARRARFAPRAGGPPDAGCAGRGGPDGCASPCSMRDRFAW